MISRRSFLFLPAALPLAVLRPASASAAAHHFQYDYVIGTSLDGVVWTSRASDAEDAERAVLREISRLVTILNTRDPQSEICRLERGAVRVPSDDLSAVLAAYEIWQERTRGTLAIRPQGVGSRRNVDALGKVYILDKAAAAAHTAVPQLDGFLLNIGGDIVTWGRPCEIAIVDPGHPYDNAAPMTRVLLRNAAVATSATYARGAHLVDARTGLPIADAAAATVIAHDAVTANALAIALCVGTEMLPLVEHTDDAEFISVDASGLIRRSSGFSRLERPRRVQTAVPADWPTGFQVTMTITLTGGGGGHGLFGWGGKRPYVAVWAENEMGKLVRILAFWGDKPRYYLNLSGFWSVTSSDQHLLYAAARATRPPGKYELVWDGLDDHGMPVPAGNYRITVESNQEKGSYGKKSGVIACGSQPSSAMIESTANTEAVTIQFGPRPSRT